MATVLSSFSRTRISQSPYSTQERDKEEDKTPVVSFESEEPVNSSDRALRYAKGRRYDKSARAPFNELHPETTEVFIVNHWSANLPALPTAESDAVIQGKIVDAKAYLSNDKTGAYGTCH